MHMACGQSVRFSMSPVPDSPLRTRGRCYDDHLGPSPHVRFITQANGSEVFLLAYAIFSLSLICAGECLIASCVVNTIREATIAIQPRVATISATLRELHICICLWHILVLHGRPDALQSAAVRPSPPTVPCAPMTHANTAAQKRQSVAVQPTLPVPPSQSTATRKALAARAGEPSEHASNATHGGRLAPA